MNTASVGNLSDSVQIPHNCNIGLIHDLVLLLFLSLLLFLEILYEILHVAGTAVEPFVVAWDSTAGEHTVQLEHTTTAVEALSFDCTTVVV